MSTSITVGDRIRAYIEARNRQLAEEAARRREEEAAQRRAEKAAEQAAAQQASQRDITQMSVDFNQDGTEDRVYVDRTRLPEISPEALLQHPEAVVAVDVNGDDVDDSRNLTELSAIADELGLTLKQGSEATKNTAYRGWSSQEIDSPPEFVENFEYMTRLAEENPGGRWELSTHPNQGAFVRYYMPEGRMTNLGTTFKETSIIRPDQYGDRITNAVGAARKAEPSQPVMPTGERADLAVQYADEVLSPTATPEQRTAAYVTAQELVNNYPNIDVGGSADITPDEFRTQLDAELQSMGMPTFRGDGLSEFDHRQLVQATNDVLDGSVTATDRRNAYLLGALAIDEEGGFKCYAPGALEELLTGVLSAEGIPTKIDPATGTARTTAAAQPLTGEEAQAVTNVLHHAARVGGIDPTQAQPVVDALLASGGDVDAIPVDVVTRLDAQAVERLSRTLLQASADPQLDVGTWLGRAPTDGVDPQELQMVQAILADMAMTVGSVGTRIQNDGALLDGSAPVEGADPTGMTPAQLSESYLGALTQLDKVLDQLASGQQRFSSHEIFSTLSTNQFADGTELEADTRGALMFLAANPGALAYFDTASDGGRTDGVFSREDLDASISYVKARGERIASELSLQAPPPTDELTPQGFLQALNVVEANLGGTVGVVSLDHALSRPETSPELRSALLSLLQSPNRLEQLGANGFDLTIRREQLEQVREEATQEVAAEVIDRPFGELQPGEQFLWSLNRLRNAVSEDLIGGWDDKFSTHELRRLITNREASQEARDAATFLIDNPDFRDLLDGADDGGKVDGTISLGDIEAAIAERSRTIASTAGSTGTEG